MIGSAASAAMAATMESALTKHLQPRIAALKVLVVDDDHYMRKVVRTMLQRDRRARPSTRRPTASPGSTRSGRIDPDLVIVDWEMPMIDGAQFVRMVRSPGDFPMPDVPIIMLSGHGDRWRVVEAARIGAHEYLLKPVSTKALLDRIVAIIGQAAPDRAARRLLRPAAAPAGGDRRPEARQQAGRLTAAIAAGAVAPESEHSHVEPPARRV